MEQRIYASYGVAGAVNELQINGTPVTNTGKPNQIVWLPLGTGRVIINEQIRSREGPGDSFTINALHVIIPGTIDLVIYSEPAEAARTKLSQNLRPEEQ